MKYNNLYEQYYFSMNSVPIDVAYFFKAHAEKWVKSKIKKNKLPFIFSSVGDIDGDWITVYVKHKAKAELYDSCKKMVTLQDSWEIENSNCPVKLNIKPC